SCRQRQVLPLPAGPSRNFTRIALFYAEAQSHKQKNADERDSRATQRYGIDQIYKRAKLLPRGNSHQAPVVKCTSRSAGALLIFEASGDLLVKASAGRDRIGSYG